MANLFKKTIKIPRYGIIAIKYLIETRDLKGLILIANKKFQIILIRKLNGLYVVKLKELKKSFTRRQLNYIS